MEAWSREEERRLLGTALECCFSRGTGTDGQRQEVYFLKNAVDELRLAQTVQFRRRLQQRL